MEITDKDMIVYDFGEKKIWPKPELDTAYKVVDHYNKLIVRLQHLSQLVNVSSGRQDHMVNSLDTTMFSLREALFEVMVLREAMTGHQTEEQQRNWSNKT